MLTNSNLSYISKNYERMGKIQDQLNTGKKITKPSDDPVIAMKGMRYRSQLVEVNQFYRNLTEGFTWMENTDAALEETTQVLNRIRELTVQAANDSYDPVARGNIAKEIEQLQQHLVSMSNTKVGDNYIFNGADTNNAPINENLLDIEFESVKTDLSDPALAKDYAVSYHGQTYRYNESLDEFIVEPMVTYKKNPQDPANPTEVTRPTASIKIDTTTTPAKITHSYLEKGTHLDGAIIEMSEELVTSNDLVVSKNNAVSTNTQDVEIEVMKGVSIPVNVRAQDAYSLDLFGGIESIKKMLLDPNTKGSDITKSVDSIDHIINGVASTRAELGARQNRAEMVENRLLQQQIVAEKTVSDNEDVDFEKAIIDLTIQESIHRASLAVGARIIQPTLMDFLR